MVTMFPLCVFIGKQPSDSSNIASVIVFGGAVRHSLTYALLTFALALKSVPAVLVRRALICASCSLCCIWSDGADKLLGNRLRLEVSAIAETQACKFQLRLGSFGWPHAPPGSTWPGFGQPDTRTASKFPCREGHAAHHLTS